jgi:hypothetical protein
MPLCKFQTKLFIEKYINVIDIEKFRTCMTRYHNSAHSLMVKKVDFMI